MTQPLVYIVLLNYNGWKDTIECLESILKLDYKNYRIVIVDNDSKDNSVENIYKWSQGEILPFENGNQFLKDLVYPNSKKPARLKILDTNVSYLCKADEILLIQSFDNKGFSAGNNIGIKYALSDSECQYVWLLNNDTVVPNDCLSNLVAKSSSNEKLGLIGSKLVYYSSPEIVQAFAGVINKNTGASTELGQGENTDVVLKENLTFDYIVGASMFVKRRFIENVGLLCEDYFLYNEEPDWCLRALAKDWSYAVFHESIVYHKQGASTGSNKPVKSEKIDLIGLRSRLLFMNKFFPQKMALVYLSFGGVIINRILRGQFKRIPKIITLVFNSLIGTLK